MKHLPKEVWVLAICQVLFTAAISVDLTITSLAGQSLTSHYGLATLPFALLTVGGALAMPLLAWQIRTYGRSRALSTGCIVGLMGAATSTASVLNQHFWGLCLGCLLVGAFQASAQFYRLAAGDQVTDELKQYAVSLVLAGGLIAAFLGPGLAIWSISLWPGSLYAGPYLTVCALTLCSAILLGISYKTDGKAAPLTGQRVSWVHAYGALREPTYFVATLNGVLTTSVMMLIMSAVPLAIVQAGWTMKEAATVMQWHLIGMYAPSLVAGYTFKKLGSRVSLALGLALTLLAALVGMHGSQLASFYGALALLGVGWNVSFVTSSILLSHGDDLDQRQAAQSASETLRYVFSSAASLTAAAVLQYIGWYGLNVAMLPLLVVGAIFTGKWIARAKSSTSP